MLEVGQTRHSYFKNTVAASRCLSKGGVQEVAVGVANSRMLSSDRAIRVAMVLLLNFGLSQDDGMELVGKCWPWWVGGWVGCLACEVGGSSLLFGSVRCACAIRLVHLSVFVGEPCGTLMVADLLNSFPLNPRSLHRFCCPPPQAWLSFFLSSPIWHKKTAANFLARTRAGGGV